jgi:hypothetical protein
LDVTRAVAQKYGILVLGSIFPFSTAKVTGRSQARAYDPPQCGPACPMVGLAQRHDDNGGGTEERAV